ncbi:winged helix DNA-binding domain-containing protein [Bacillus salipaludis]|uniref:Winged helix DNA-binding domain-containing protein n=1 Tax=Bacillus salipaludis TaxID=2547811 RepID=A0ABW8RE26_9BACI
MEIHMKQSKTSQGKNILEGTPTVISTRALNRALLARQMLLTREQLPVLNAVERLVGMQAQDPNAPYFGLFARLEQFLPEELSQLIQDRKVVRIALMRSTIHLVSSHDCLYLRPLVQSVHERGLKGSYGKYIYNLDVKEVAKAGRTMVETKPLTFKELGKQLNDKWPDFDPAALAAVVRTSVPLVQLPPRGLWGESGQAVHTSAEAWLGNSLSSKSVLDDMILRYLAAFGPASVQDIQTWSGLTRLSETVERLLPQLVNFHDNQGNELFDIPDAPRPDENILSPPRFLGGFDNMLLSYANRKRIIDEDYHKLVFTKNGIIKPTILIDGFVSGIWKVKREQGILKLIIQLFKQLSNHEYNTLTDEGSRLLDFITSEEVPREIVFL